MAAADGLRIDWRPDHGLSLTDSGGPSSCVLFSCSPDDLDVLRGHLGDAPVTVVAELG